MVSLVWPSPLAVHRSPGHLQWGWGLDRGGDGDWIGVGMGIGLGGGCVCGYERLPRGSDMSEIALLKWISGVGGQVF
jgi:hypothetical protein